MKKIVKSVTILSLILAGIVMLRVSVIRADEMDGSAEIPNYKTHLYGGDIEKCLRLDIMPKIKSLASGKTPEDEYRWDFDDAPIYTEGPDEWSARREFIANLGSRMTNPKQFMLMLGESPIGFFSLGGLAYITETRKVSDDKYVCALVCLRASLWCSPYGGSCTRDEAIGYQKKCQNIINKVAKKVISARQPNGKPLTKKQKLKWVHDWLVMSVEYDYKGLNAYKNEAKGTSRYGHIYNEYGALVDGKAVCGGYAQAFKAIIDELVRRGSLAVKCDIATGGNHAWNRVKIDGVWYNIDVTWDDQSSKDFFAKDIESKNFLVSDKKHYKGVKYSTYSKSKEPAKDRRFEGKKWPRYKKSLKDCTVTLKYPNKVYVYKGKQIIPKVVVKYGKNVVPSKAYRVVRVDKKKTGMAKIKIVPSKKCTALKGSISGPSFKITKAKKVTKK